MSLQGVLRDFGAADVFQMIAQQRKTGVLEVKNGAVTLIVTFKDGHVVRARPAEARPDEALASMLLRTRAVSETDLAEVRRTQPAKVRLLALPDTVGVVSRCVPPPTNRDGGPGARASTDTSATSVCPSLSVTR